MLYSLGKLWCPYSNYKKLLLFTERYEIYCYNDDIYSTGHFTEEILFFLIYSSPSALCLMFITGKNGDE
jgi:hypothetical protein